MKKTLTLFLATTTLATAIGIPSWAAVRSVEAQHGRTHVVTTEATANDASLILASGDDDDGDDHDRSLFTKLRKWADDDDDDDEDDDYGAARNPAPAGTVAPPSNGLFGNATPPKVQMN